MRLLLGLLALPLAWSDYFPIVKHSQYFPAPAKPLADCTPEAWQPPKLQPWEPLRALPHSVTVAWIPAWHPWCEINHYHIEMRRPGSFPLRFHDLEGLQHRELDTEDEDWPGDAEWTNWQLVYSGLSRAYTFEVDTSKGHAVQFRVRACGRRIKPGYDLTLTYAARGMTFPKGHAKAGAPRYEVIKEPRLGMRWHTDREYVAADLGWFTARRGFVYVRTAAADKDIKSNTILLSMHCPTACHVYLCYDYQAIFQTHYWFESEGWTVDYNTPRPYPRIEIMYKLFPAGPVHIRGDTDYDWAHTLPLIFVKEGGCPHPSNYSGIQTTHTVLDAAYDKINFYVLGMGKNSPDYTTLIVNRQTLYRRRDETGLVLAIFSRLDFSMHHLETYDTHRNRSRSLAMSQDIRKFNQSFFVFVISTIAWEWYATRTLAHTMEYCGAYHFGQWVHVFAEQPHYESPKSDLQHTASQDQFGHPYAFIGIPGIGTGHGWESLMFNTGHYIPSKSVNVPKALMRGTAYYDYVARIWRIEDLSMNQAEFFKKNKPPQSETIHNPNPARKTKPDLTSTMLPNPFNPYVGTLQNHITSLIEANETVPPFNYAFVLYTIANVTRVDPRPKKNWVTEYERVWSGASARYDAHTGVQIHEGLLLQARNCTMYLTWGYAEASPESCGEDFTCNDPAPLNDFGSRAAMVNAGWVFSWSNLLSFQPDKYRYDLSGKVPWTSYWGLDNPWSGSISLLLRGKGTFSISFGNCWKYSLGKVELFVNGILKETATSLQISKSVTMDFSHLDNITIQETEAVTVLNGIEISCWGCCQTVDYPNVIATKCDIGVTPTLCRNLSKYQLTNLSNFRVIDTHADKLSTGTR